MTLCPQRLLEWCSEAEPEKVAEASYVWKCGSVAFLPEEDEGVGRPGGAQVKKGTAEKLSKSWLIV